MLAARPRANHRRAAAGAVALIVIALASSARAQDAWSSHARVWFGADLALAPVGRYSRELPVPQSHGRSARGGSLAASFFYVGEGPLGIGLHVAPTMLWVDQPEIDGRVLLVDIGLSPLTRLSWEAFDLTLRVPIGLTTGRLNWVRDRDEHLSTATGNNDLGLGMHVGPQLGGVLWLGEFVGVRLESGVMFRRMNFDEGKKQPFPGDVTSDTLHGNVRHHSWTWTVTLGFVRRLDPHRLPDENGPPLPTPDYYQPYPLTSL
jgi:hypothetical protein